MVLLTGLWWPDYGSLPLLLKSGFDAPLIDLLSLQLVTQRLVHHQDLLVAVVLLD